MKHPRSLLLLSASVGMVLNCFSAGTSFILACLSLKPIPVFKAAFIVLSAMLITTLQRRRGWLRIQVGLVHLAAAGMLFLKLLYDYSGRETPFWNWDWIGEMVPADPLLGGFQVGFMAVSTCLLWFLGIRLITKPDDAETLSRRFDAGLACFLSLFLVKWIILLKEGGIGLEHTAVVPFLSYMILGLFTLGRVRVPRRSPSVGISFLGNAGMVLSFAGAAFLFGGGLFMLFGPELRTAADTGVALFQSAARPFVPILVQILRFAVVGGCHGKLREAATTDTPPLPAMEQQSGGLGPFEFLFIGFSVVMLLFMAGFIGFIVFRWLFSKPEGKIGRRSLWAIFLSGFYGIMRFFAALWNRVRRGADSYDTARAHYRRLLRWGRFSGIPRVPAETPREYGRRLGTRFPRIAGEIRHLIDVHDDAVYGSVFPDAAQAVRMKTAWRKIRNPGFWWDRMRSLAAWERS